MNTKANPFTEQIMRLSSLQRFPMYPQGITELRDTLKKSARTPERAKKTVDLLIYDREVCPTPREISDMAYSIAQKEECAPGGCEECRGLPWVQSDRGALRCSCPKGRWLLAKDRERAVKEPEVVQ